MHALLPVITTRRADRRDRGYLAWVAIANEVAHLPLDMPPVDASTHTLEIQVDGFDEPLVVLADPVGVPTEEGFPLRLRPLDDDHADELRRELFGANHASASSIPTAPPPVITTASIPPSLSDKHAASLSRASVPPEVPRRRPGALAGRTLGHGRFALEALIGAGASGEVYRGVHNALRRPIAIKVLHPTLQNSRDYSTRFYAEALAASHLDHRNVLRILDYGQEPDGLLFIIMELLEGESLQDILDREGALPVKRITNYVTQACAGLAHAHDYGVVHRDIKPENIVVVRHRDDEGREGELVKVCDFGIAHWTTSAHEDLDRPDASKVVGTPAYMAPEQIRNESVDARTDVYALGVVLYELATGRLPFDAPEPLQILVKHIEDAPVPPSELVPDLPVDLERVILKALSKDPEDRQRDTRVLRAELRDVVDEPPSVRAVSPPATSSMRSMKAVSILSAAELVTSPEEALAKLATNEDERARILSVDATAHAMRLSILAGNTATASTIAAWLESRGSDVSVPPEERDHVERALRELRNPDLADELALRALGGEERADEGARLLAVAGPVAARALIDGRRKGGVSLELRGRFVAAVRATGPSSLPILVETLAPLVPLTTRSDELFAEDLLRAMPEAPSDDGGEVCMKFVRVDKPGVGTAAISAVAALWGRRAQPLLLGVLDCNVDGMRIAAVEALGRIEGVDEGAVDRVARLVVGRIPAGPELRAAAAAVLATAGPDARRAAVTFLQQRLSVSNSFVSSMRHVFGQRTTRDEAEVVLAMANSLVALDAATARPVLERLAAARADVRSDVENLLTRL